MHSKHSHTLPSSLITGCLLCLLSACSFLSTSTPAPNLQATVLTSPTATPTPRISDTALLTYTDHTQAVLSLAWSPDGKRIVSGGGTLNSSAGFDIRVWNATTGQTLLTYRGEMSNIWSVDWSPDGRRIASADDTGTVQVWDAKTGGNVFQYDGQSGSAFALGWSPDGTRIASGGADKTVQIWRAE